jgi:hypothetical protein
MIENGQTYFDDSQRLTDYELGQFETHSEYYSRLLERRENNQETHNYIAYMSGTKIPKTLDEQIIVKLIY